MTDFYKTKNGEYLEGHLGKPEEFNGIVFLLREPNDKKKDIKRVDGKEEEDNKFFWFKNVLCGGRIYNECDSEKDKKRSMTAGTKYKNRFREMLRYIKHKDEDLNDAIFCNVHPEWGNTYKSDEYEETKQPNIVQKMKLIESRAQQCKVRTLTIFTCKDIYDILKKMYEKNGCLVKEENEMGLRYRYGRKKSMGMFRVQTEVCTINFYEMYHPSYGSGIMERTEDVEK